MIFGSLVQTFLKNQDHHPLSFEVEKFYGCRNGLLFARKHSRLHGSLVWPNYIVHTGHYCYFTGKVSWLPIDPQKLQKFKI